MDNRKIKVLIIDDDIALTKIIKFSLTQNGFEVNSVTDAETGLSEIEKEQFDFFLVDLILPGMNGFDFVRKLKQIPKYKNTPALIITARSSAEDDETAHALGTEGIFIKPFYLEDLFEKIDGILKKKQQQETRG